MVAAIAGADSTVTTITDPWQWVWIPAAPPLSPPPAP
jgi:hypothetical protein